MRKRGQPRSKDHLNRTWLGRGGPRLGAHMSIAGGVDKAFLRGEEVGCDAMQIFTKNNNQWRAAPLTEQVIEAYKTNRRQAGIDPILAHDSYLINIASP